MGIIRSLELLVLLVQAKRTIKKFLFAYSDISVLKLRLLTFQRLVAFWV